MLEWSEDRIRNVWVSGLTTVRQLMLSEEELVKEQSKPVEEQLEITFNMLFQTCAEVDCNNITDMIHAITTAKGRMIDHDWLMTLRKELQEREELADRILATYEEDAKAVEWLVPLPVLRAAAMFNVVTERMRRLALEVPQGGALWKLLREGVINASQEEKTQKIAEAGFTIFVPPRARDIPTDVVNWRQMVQEKLHRTFAGNMFTRHGNLNEPQCHALCVAKLRDFFKDTGVTVEPLKDEGSRFDDMGTSNASIDAWFLLVDEEHGRLEVIGGEYKCPQSGYGPGKVKLAHTAQIYKQMAIYEATMVGVMEEECEKRGFKKGGVMKYHTAQKAGKVLEEEGYPAWERPCSVYATLPRGSATLETLTVVYAPTSMPLSAVLERSQRVWLRCWIPFRALHMARWLRLAELFPREYLDLVEEECGSASDEEEEEVLTSSDEEDEEMTGDAIMALVHHTGTEMDPLAAIRRRKGGYDTGTIIVGGVSEAMAAFGDDEEDEEVAAETAVGNFTQMTSLLM